MKHQDFKIEEGAKVKLADFDPHFTGHYQNKEEAAADLAQTVERIGKLQDVMYAQNIHALLLIFQAMDAAGKDSTIKHVLTGVNPQGIEVTPFKPPTEQEYDHDYLWRASKALPSRGKIGVFSRSYYEEVLVVRVHPEILQAQRLPNETKNNKRIWQQRFEEIRNFESYLKHNGVHVLKFFINISKDEQKKQLMERIEDPVKHWKFSYGDIEERSLWDEYMRAYEDAIGATSTHDAPWYIIPGNRRWFTRAIVAQIVADKLQSLDLEYPAVTDKQKQEIAEAKRILESER
jgi:PPK2 family polyphosphate:nucleotide phosphotransferase